MTRYVVVDATTAAAAGMTGSPTLLIDGTDPFARAGLEPSLSCRLYPHEDGHAEGAPSVAALRRAIERCRAPTSGAAALRGARRRATPADPAARAVHRAILHTFAAIGRPPAVADLEPVAGRGDATTVLRQLHEADVIRLDTAGDIRVAYPFSATPTRHRVHLATGADVYAMCAIDALGMPAMLDVDATITTCDPATGETVTVTVANGQSIWEPPTAVAYVGTTSHDGPSADTCCDHLNLFTDPANVTRWTAEHPAVDGEVLTGMEAERLGRQIFGGLLTD